MSETLFNKEVKCPVCELKFTTKKVKSASIKVLKRDSDFCAYYAKDNPTFYGVFVCPQCGYASFESIYQDLTVAQIARVGKKVGSNWSGKNYGGKRSLNQAIEVHKLALLNFNVMVASKFHIAKACLRLSWFYRMLEDEEREIQFMKHAAESYEQAFTTEEFENAGDEEYVVCYILGELNRKLGNFRKAVSFYDLAIRNPEIEHRQQVKKMAQDQRLLASEEYRRQKEAQKKAKGEA